MDQLPTSHKFSPLSWKLYVEYSTRISSAALDHQSGTEKAALDSLFKLFVLTREEISKNPSESEFGLKCCTLLNGNYRSFLAKWHRNLEQDKLLSRDSQRQFRGELEALRQELNEFCKTLNPAHAGHNPGSNAQHARKFNEADLSWGLQDEIARGVEEKYWQKGDEGRGEPCNLTAVALSGGGIRSATFCQGVLTALSRKGVLQNLNYLSTVSGGGYLGALIVSHKANFGPDCPLFPLGEKNIISENPAFRSIRQHSQYFTEPGWSKILATTGIGILRSLAYLAVPPSTVAIFFLAGHLTVPNLPFWLVLTFLVTVVSFLWLCICAATELLTENRAARLLASLCGKPALLTFVLSSMSALCLGELQLAAWTPVWLVPLLGIGALIISFVSINLWSPYAYYKSVLQGNYCTTAGMVADWPDLEKASPYPLFNVAVNLPGSKNPSLLFRRTDFGLITKDYWGSNLLGLHPRENSSHLSLSDAMAISGAAVAPYMGTYRLIAGQLLALLNFRVSKWVPNPDPKKSGWMWPPLISLQEILGSFHENSRWVNLSDGGHAENLGIYQLLKRRCKYIVAIDAEADPQREFSSLLLLNQYAKIDLNTEIKCNLDDLRLDGKYSRSHHALWEIKYPGEHKGYLLYIKSSMTGDESEFIRDYQRRHPEFPQQSTAEQLFTEDQFEAYRALGEHVGNDLFRDDLIDKTNPPTSTESFFRQLSEKLL